MVPNIKGYLSALAQEVLPAFRRGVIAVTALAYIVLVGAYFLVGGTFALSTIQLWTGALVIAIAEVLIILPYRLWKANVTEINALKAINYNGPDWTIRELFQHIMPDGLTERDNHETVGLDVQDKLASGQLLAWGRRANGRPLQLIGLLFWEQANFTYWFLADGHDGEEHAISHSLLTVANEAYRDIHVNKGSALRIWPK
jgi:hypothetical protein